MVIKAKNLFSSNSPKSFWCCQDDIREYQWQDSIKKSIHVLELKRVSNSIDDILADVLGEKQFGLDHWHLSSTKRAYYYLKPFLPRSLTRKFRGFYTSRAQKEFLLDWPIERRYVQFQFEVMRNLLMISNRDELSFFNFWPGDKKFAFVLTHDVETAKGQDFVREIIEVEESLGFCSSFNFVPERYSLDHNLMSELGERGFEIGVHGLKHDGKLFFSFDNYKQRISRINGYLRDWNAVGFRAPLMIRNPYWLQLLDIDYDSSFFDTDPFEPIPGGTMSIWPFRLGHFIELPYTLVQDYTLIDILGETSPTIWLDKVKFIKENFGMALLNTHPDYLKKKKYLNVYCDFLEKMSSFKDYWHGLAKDVAKWWRDRSESENVNSLSRGIKRKIFFVDGNIEIV